MCDTVSVCVCVCVCDTVSVCVCVCVCVCVIVGTVDGLDMRYMWQWHPPPLWFRFGCLVTLVMMWMRIPLAPRLSGTEGCSVELLKR